MAQTIREMLPAVYADLLDDVFDRVAIDETRATCGDCAMCEGDTPRTHENITFLPSTKCCTFHPQLPNYLVGALLIDDASDMAEGRSRLRQQIASRLRVTPRWVAPSRKARAIYLSARHAAFGRSETLLCPYYDDGDCTIWRYRESYCSTFFCKHVGGEDSRQFWRRLRAYLEDVERILAMHLVSVVAPELVEPKPAMTLDELEDRAPGPDVYARWWGDWVGREEELYRRCAEELQSVDRNKLETLWTRRAVRRLPLVGEALTSAGSTCLPEELMLASDVRGEAIPGTDTTRVTGYSEYDPIVLRTAVFGALSKLTEATPIGELRALFAAAPYTTGADDDSYGGEQLLVQLNRWRVLVSPGQEQDV